jgi:hypothetical protein
MTYGDKTTRDALRKPFPKSMIGKIPAGQGRPALDYVGHAAVTDRLNQAAPDWSYTIDKLFDHGNDAYVLGTMTIGGVSRQEYGDGKTPKEAVSNFIRRGAMRFGVALDLWSKEELESSPAGGSSNTSYAGDPSSEGVGATEEGSSIPSADPSGTEAHSEGDTRSQSTVPEDPPPSPVESSPGGGGVSPEQLWLEARSLIGTTGAVVKFAAQVLGRTVSQSQLTAEDLAAVIAAKRAA